MKKLNKKIDLFCYKHPRFGIANIMTYIVIGNVAVWLFCLMDRTGTLASLLSLSPAAVLHGQVWRLVTFLFVPTDFSPWALLFFYFYYWIGNVLEQHWGTPRFSIFLLTGVVLTVIYDFVLFFITGTSFYATTEYIYLSMFFSFATLFPDLQVLFMFIIPVKVKWLAFVDAAFFVYEVIVLPFPLNLLPVVAVLNYFIFFGDELIDMLRRSRPRNNPTVTNFRREKSRMKYEDREKHYNHKCAVCGRTDTEYPKLEFRYCSRCVGYHCFCEEHINSHVHFTE